MVYVIKSRKYLKESEAAVIMRQALSAIKYCHDNAISNNTQRYRQLQELIDQRIVRVRDEMASDLVELENEYYSSPNKG